jgi:hypothetical protein
MKTWEPFLKIMEDSPFICPNCPFFPQDIQVKTEGGENNDWIGYNSIVK